MDDILPGTGGNSFVFSDKKPTQCRLSPAEEFGRRQRGHDFRQRDQPATQCRRPARGGHSLRRLGHLQGVCHRFGVSRLPATASFWLIAAMCLLTGLVGLNYVVICKHYPDGGGVYASVRHRSEVVSIVGAFLLIADYIVTAAISALSAFQYLGTPHPEIFAAAAIAAIGALNLLGPKHTGALAVVISVLTAAVVLILGAFTLPHLGAKLSTTCTSAHRRSRQELERVCLHRAGALGRGGYCQRHRRDEARSRAAATRSPVSRAPPRPRSCGWPWRSALFTALLGLAYARARRGCTRFPEILRDSM